MAKYSEAQRALALEILERNNRVLDANTLKAIRAALETPKLSRQLVWHWSNTTIDTQSNPGFTPKNTKVRELALARHEAQSKAAEKLDELLERAARKFIAHATQETVVADMTGQQAMTSAAIAIDKMRLLQNLPTEIVGVVVGLVQKIEKRGMNVAGVFKALEDIIDAEIVDAER